MKPLSIFLMVVFFNLSLFSQNEGCWYRYGDGNRVVEIAEDGAFIWVCQANGLAKIDKTSHLLLELYNKENSPMQVYEPSCVAIDQDGSKWVGLPGIGVGKLSGDQWIVYDSLNSPLTGNAVVGPRIREIFVATNGKLWFGSASNGVYSFDGATWTNYNMDNSPIPFNFVNVIKEDTDGAIWIGTGYTFGTVGGLAKLNTNGTWEVFTTTNSSIPANGINDLLIETDNTVWIATKKGLTKYDGSNWSTYFENKYVFSLAMDAPGNLYAGMSGGVVRKFDKVNSWEDIEVPAPITYNNRINDILIDSEQSLWAVSFANDGLFQYKNNEWQEVTPLVTGLELTPIVSITKSADQHYWLGTYYWGVFEFDGASDWTFYETFTKPLPDWRILEIVERQGKIIMGKQDAFGYQVTEWDGITETELFAQSGNSTLNTVWLYDFELAGDVLWVATSNGLHKYDGVWEHFYTNNSGLPTNVIHGVEVVQNIVWLTTSAGLVKFDGSQWTIWNTSNSTIPTNNLRQLDLDEQNNPWFLTGDIGIPMLVKFDGIDFSDHTDASFSTQSNRYDLLVRNEQEIYVAHFSGFSTNASGNWELHKSSIIFDIYEDGDKLLFGGSEGLLIYDPACSTPSEAAVEWIAPAGLSMFPNPFSQQLFIDAEKVEKPYRLRVVDMLGRVVYEAGGWWQKTAVLQRGSLVAGLYSVVVVDAGGRRHLGKVVVE